MTSPSADSFEPLLSNRARIGWGVPVATPRPSMSVLYEFGGGYPDPASFPYEGMVEATADMTYGEPQGYRGLRELICYKYELFEKMKADPENIIVANGSGQALALAFGAYIDPGDVVMTQEAFEDYKIRNRLTVVSDGEEALAYLRREGTHADAPRPDLNLLDRVHSGLRKL